MRNTKSLLLAFVLGAVIAGQMAICVGEDVVTGSELAGPEIEFEETAHDFGTVEEGDVVRVDYTFSNRGDQPLTITKVKTSCGCTTADTGWNEAIAPGESGKIPIVLRTDRLGGKVHKSITVTSNAKSSPETILSLTGTVEQLYEITPRVASFGMLESREGEKQMDLMIKNTSDIPLRLGIPECDNPSFEAQLIEVVEGKEFTLRVKTKPPLKYGPNRAVISIKADQKTAKVLSISAFAIVHGPAQGKLNHPVSAPRPTQAPQAAQE